MSNLNQIDSSNRGEVGEGHGQASNIIDEIKHNYGSASGVTKDIGKNMSGETTSAELKSRLDEDSTAGMKVGDEVDAHEAAASKQP